MSKNILILDDDDIILTLAAKMLQESGYEPLVARDFDQYKQLLDTNIDLVISDVHLPEGNGLEYVIRHKRLRKLNHPVIAITADSDPKAVAHAFDSGADDYIGKPIRQEELLARVKIQLKLQEFHQNMLHVLNAQTNGSILIDDNDNVVFANAAANKLFNRRNADTKMPIAKWLQVTDEELYLFNNAIINCPHSEQNFVSQLHITGEATPKFVEVKAIPSQFDSRYKLLIINDETEVIRLKNELNAPNSMIGESSTMAELKSKIYQLARVDWTAVIIRESGVGKELVASAIHKQSERHNGPFVTVNCAGLSSSLLEDQLFGHEKGAFTGADKQHIGYFEQADGGTLFLDEIGDLPLPMQGALLRVLQEKSVTRVGSTKQIDVDVRILLATNRNLQQLANEDVFRKDLFYRVSSVTLNVPPVRDRGNDITLLLTHYLTLYAAEFSVQPPSFSTEATAWFKEQDWTGNIRQIQQVCKSIILRSPNLVTLSLAKEAYGVQNSQDTLTVSLHDISRREIYKEILEAIKQCNGSKSMAAKKLGISRATLYRHLSQK